MTTSVSRARRWSMTTAGFGADVYLFVIVGLVFWLLLPTLMLGWSPVLIASGSMSPAIRPGDIVLIKDTVADEPLGAGTIITYTDPREDRDRLVTHRIAETALTPEADTVAEYITRGDANAVDDASPVPHDQVVGSARLLIPLLGLPVHWARSAENTSLSVFALLTLTAITVASDTARRTAVSVRPSRQQLRRNSRFAQRERAVVAARASRAAQAAQAAGVAAMTAQAQLARHDRAGQAGIRPTADGGVPNLMSPRFDVPVAGIRPSPTTDAAPPVQRGVGAASVAGASGPDTDDPTAGRAAPSRASTPTGAEPHKPRLTPVAVLREPPRRARKRHPSRLLMFLLLTGLTAGGAAIPGTGAALTAVASSTGNMFATAAPDDPDPDVNVAVDIFSDWGPAYCANVVVSTTSSTPIVWDVDVDLSTFPRNGVPYDVWNATTSYDPDTKVLSATGAGWNGTVVDGSTASFGFCADRPAAPDGDATFSLEVTTEWPEGYCAQVTVSTDSTTPVTWQAEIDPATDALGGVPYEVWSAEWSFDPDTGVLTAVGESWNATVVAGEDRTFGFCANRPAEPEPEPDPDPSPDPPGDLVLPPFEGASIVDSTGNPPGQYTTFAFDVGLGQQVALDGAAVAELRVRRNGPGNSPGDAVVRLFADDDQIATGSSSNVTGNAWQTISIALDPTIAATFDTSTTFTVEVDLRRLEMDLADEQSRIVLPHAL